MDKNIGTINIGISYGAKMDVVLKKAREKNDRDCVYIGYFSYVMDAMLGPISVLARNDYLHPDYALEKIDCALEILEGIKKHFEDGKKKLEEEE